MEKGLVVFIGNSTISIVDQYRLQLQANLPILFLLPHKNEVVFEKLFHVLKADPKSDRAVNLIEGELGSCIFITDKKSPYIKTKREENEKLVQQYEQWLTNVVDDFDFLFLIGESSCSFDAVVMEYLIDQLTLKNKKGHVVSWCPIQSELAQENNQSLLEKIEQHHIAHTVVVADDTEPDGFLSLFKAYNKEIAQTVHRIFQQD